MHRNVSIFIDSLNVVALVEISEIKMTIVS